MFVDTAKVFVQAGRGGNGAVSFRREIYIDMGGLMAAMAVKVAMLSSSAQKASILLLTSVTSQS